MNQRYNIALIPNVNQKVLLIELSQRYFAAHHAGYLLGPKSIPHITLCQFETNSSELQPILSEFDKTLSQKSFAPDIKSLSIVKHKDESMHYHSVELGIVRSEAMVALHRQAVEFIQLFGLRPKNPAGEVYRPHITLSIIATSGDGSQDKWGIPYQILEQLPTLEPFQIALGRADQYWQFVEQLLGLPSS